LDPSGSAGFQIRISGWISRRRVERCACITQSRLTRAKRLRVRHAVDIKNICDFRICIFGFTIFHFRHISCVGAWPWAVGVIYTCSPDLKSDFEKKSKIRENRNEPRTHVQRTVCAHRQRPSDTHKAIGRAHFVCRPLSYRADPCTNPCTAPHATHAPSATAGRSRQWSWQRRATGRDGCRRRPQETAGERREQAARRGAATRATDEAAATRRREGAAAGGDGWSAEAGGGGWRGREDAGARRRREDAAVGRGGRRHCEETDDLQTRHPCICEDRR
jgi:hypothetical protein